VLAPLSWLRDFAPFPDDTAALTAALDDLGLVVEGVERVGEGLDSVVVARIDEISAIEGADKVRRVLVNAGPEHPVVEIVCGATNFALGDRVPLAHVGAVLPGGFEIAARKMRGVSSNGMLCSGNELGLTEDAKGLLILDGDSPAEPGTPITAALGIGPDTIFDITVEGNRPDAWSIAGIARDLANRLGLPFTMPEPHAPASSGEATGSVASAVVEAADLCPRLTVTVLRHVEVRPSPDWVARRLTLAGMRPINNVVDASNYVMLERGQPTHPYDLSRLPGPGLLVRRATVGETLETLDGTTRTLGRPGPGLGDTGEDCLICDAEGTPVGIAGIMGGASSEISDGTTDILFEAAAFLPMAIARSSKRLGLRTEASARFEKGCDPWAIDGAITRFCELLAETCPGLSVADALLDVRGDLPDALIIAVPVARVQRQVGLPLTTADITRLIEPLGFACQIDADGEVLSVTVPTHRPDIRPAPFGIDDVIEEVARTFGYSNVPRHTPTWPQPGHLNELQRSRRAAKEVLCGLGASEGWTNTFQSEATQAKVGLTGLAVQVTNPLDADEPLLRRSLMPGLLGALAYNASRRQGAVRLFEVGVVFSHPDQGSPRVVERAGAGGRETALLPGERELLSAVFAEEDDDARTATVAWYVLADRFRLTGVHLKVTGEPVPGLHPTRSSQLVVGGRIIGTVGEIDPDVALGYDLRQGAGSTARRIGWLEIDLGLLFDETVVPRRDLVAAAVSRFPSSDIDLALVVEDGHPADVVAEVLRSAAGELLESVSLFDVYRGTGVPEGWRSLAYRLRFCATDHTLTDTEVGTVRQACIDRVAQEVGAVLR
jgi:phenylalanyl-tRNA synthetase beta chain